MKTTRILAATALVGTLIYGVSANAADSAAGQKLYATGCKGCHAKKAVFVGKSAADLETSINAVVGGTVKHPKKITLSADDISNVAAYIASLPAAK
jgi:mono/diheme cytochrome c family protein